MSSQLNNITEKEAIQRAEIITNVDLYDITLDLSDSETTFGLQETITFSARPETSTWIDALTDSIISIELNGHQLNPSKVSNSHRIQLENLQKKNKLKINALMKYTNTGEGLHRFVDPADEKVYLYSQFEVPDSRRVFAVFEQPDIKSQFKFTVIAPENWIVTSNSATPEPIPTETNRTTKTWSFQPTEVISSYITAIIAGPYEKVESKLTSSNGHTVDLGIFARQSLMEYVDADNIFNVTKEGFAFYEKQFGIPYPFEKYDQLFVPDFNAGAMENAGAVTFLENYVFRSKPTGALVERRAITILHELAHMWFGDLVTMKWWNDLWLNESFAEYMSHLAAVQGTQEFSNAWVTFLAMEKSWAYRQDQLPSTHPIVAEINDLEDVLVNFDGITYAKGASVLKQLVSWVHQDNFMSGINKYFEKYAYKNTVLKDLLTELEASSGRDLTTWSQQWLETAGVNTLTPRVERNNQGKISSFTIDQSAPKEYPTLRYHLIGIGVYTQTSNGSFVRSYYSEHEISGQSTSIDDLVGLDLPEEKSFILVNDNDLSYAKIDFTGHDWEVAKAHLKDVTNTLARTLIWNAAWNATRDGRLPARDFIGLVLNNIAFEDDSSLISTLLRQMNTAAEFYTPSTAVHPRSVIIADFLWELVQSADAGSDKQLQFVRTFASFAQTSAQVAIVRGLYDRTISLKGLELDPDMTWHLLTCLATGTSNNPDSITDISSQIEAQYQEDTTASGQLWSERASASISIIENKRKVWAQIMDEKHMKNSIQSAKIDGFTNVHNGKILEEFSEPYFESIEQIWNTRSPEIAQQILEGLYPFNPPTQKTVDRTDEVLKELGDRIPAVSRILLENQDTVRRALHAQKADNETIEL